jgi:uncharacterized ferritin-like protein (DUF455 family)
MPTDLRLCALQALYLSDPQQKCDLVSNLQQAQSKQVLCDTEVSLVAEHTIPGLPAKPELVHPLKLEKRSMRTPEGRATLIHALTHIEFNAINLALDAIWRFAGMPLQYYLDWLKVAAEEAYHFSLLNQHLKTLGYEYGSFSGHNSLWEMVEKTKDDVLARMALVPRTLEARGLDACPAIRNKLAQAKDMVAAEILDIILRDEIGHVAIGNHWFNYLCDQRLLNPIAAFESLRQQYQAPTLRPPFNIEARRLAGFTEVELSYLNGVTV